VIDYVFVTTRKFEVQFKQLCKRHKSLLGKFDDFLKEFDHKKGKFIPKTGGAQKIRMKPEGKGKRSGYRVIYFFKMGKSVYLLVIYSKLQKDDLSELEKQRIKNLIQKLKRTNSLL